ncbi:T-cell surface glycoprotein CD4-like isoform X2 [Varanus komodoensis]|uniref:T-cell surface glycoprotein CD4-like isoform X2 n=1 Tax=Varanus komodoensis TaxID=61221 RepID=UPI001CF7BCA9|nr:T-cell surface glycoprotein CD4-like isoform X2 [Varanus komodoensis]
MGPSSVLVTFAFHLVYLSGATLPASVVTDINAIAGIPVVLPCPYGPMEKNLQQMTWKHEEKTILLFGGFKSNRSATYTFADQEKKNLSLLLPEPKKGRYTCGVADKILRVFHLTVWNVTGTPRRWLLEGETLLLELHSTDIKPDIKIEWLDPHKRKVTGKEPLRSLQSNSRKLQIKNLASKEDQGTWECHVLPNGPRISYVVTVIGLLHQSDDGITFAAVDSNISLSCSLNVDIRKEESIARELTWKWKKNNTTLMEKQILLDSSNSLPVKGISLVQFEDAGQYQCHLDFKHRYLEKTIHLIVMKVSADPPHLTSKEANVTLCCHTSARLPPKAKLCWEHANESICDPHLPENKFCHVTRTAGQWLCNLVVKNSVKIRIKYLLEAVVKKDFPLAVVLYAAGALLLLIMAGVCALTCKKIQRKRKIAKRISQARQHLLAKRTCQCQRTAPGHVQNVKVSADVSRLDTCSDILLRDHERLST